LSGLCCLLIILFSSIGIPDESVNDGNQVRLVIVGKPFYLLHPLIPGQIDLGHKYGEEWWRRKEKHIKKQSTRKEVIEAENDPDIYQYKDRSTNRSHRNEKKKTKP